MASSSKPLSLLLFSDSDWRLGSWKDSKIQERKLLGAAHCCSSVKAHVHFGSVCICLQFDRFQQCCWQCAGPPRVPVSALVPPSDNERPLSVFVDFDRQSPDESQSASVIGKIRMTWGRRASSSSSRSSISVLFRCDDVLPSGTGSPNRIWRRNHFFHIPLAFPEDLIEWASSS
jgi:hypothetical protein